MIADSFLVLTGNLKRIYVLHPSDGGLREHNFISIASTLLNVLQYLPHDLVNGTRYINC